MLEACMQTFAYWGARRGVLRIGGALLFPPRQNALGGALRAIVRMELLTFGHVGERHSSSTSCHSMQRRRAVEAVELEPPKRLASKTWNHGKMQMQSLKRK
mmetsp:Transcript_12192/g.28240  ORF Transcript_12192/g.28240 Transcript_12192/m.28240 type:complete len:101 (-) Transcript_12192:196-498(-)